MVSNSSSQGPLFSIAQGLCLGHFLDCLHLQPQRWMVLETYWTRPRYSFGRRRHHPHRFCNVLCLVRCIGTLSTMVRLGENLIPVDPKKLFRRLARSMHQERVLRSSNRGLFRELVADCRVYLRAFILSTAPACAYGQKSAIPSITMSTGYSSSRLSCPRVL